MKDHEDDVVQANVEKSTVAVDSTTVDGIATERLGVSVGEMEGVSGMRDEGEDVMANIVCVDAVEDSAWVNLDCDPSSDGLVEERMEMDTITHDLVLEKVPYSGEGVCDDLVGSRVSTFEEDEVAVNEEGVKRSVHKEASHGVVVTTIGSGSDDDVQKSRILVNDSEFHFESLNRGSQVCRGDTAVIDLKEPTQRGLTDEVMEQKVSTVAEVAEGDCVMDKIALKEAEVLDSSKISESSITAVKPCSEEVYNVIVEEGFDSKNEAHDSVLVDPSLVCPNNQSSSTKVVNLGTGEVDESGKEESLHPTIEVITDDIKGHETVESLGREPPFVGEKSLIDRGEGCERALPKEVMEQPMECEQEVADEDHVADKIMVNEFEVFDSVRISKPLTTENPGSEDVDVVVIDEGLSSKDGALAGVFMDPNLLCPDNRKLLTEVDNGNADQQAKVSDLSVKETSHLKTEAIRNIDQILENGTGVGDSNMAVESLSRYSQFKGEMDAIVREETERVLTMNGDIVERCTAFAQGDACGDGVRDEIDRGDEVLDSSKIPGSLTTVNLDPEAALASKNQPEFSMDQTIPVTANKVIEIDNEGQNRKVEFPITDAMSDSIEDQGLKSESMSAKPSNDQFLFNSGKEVPTTNEMNSFQVSADVIKEVDGVTSYADVRKHGVLTEDLEFSYEDDHIERGEDAGVDIDEVLGWKDEMLVIDASSGNAGCAEEDRCCEISGNSEADVCEQVLTEHQEEIIKSREPIVYGRRAHVEVPLFDAQEGSRSPLEDENLEVETDSEEDDEFEEEELKAIEQSTGIDEVSQHLENESSVSLHQSRYFQPPEHEGQFSVSDLVWGKVRSHPWWPGQIIDPSDASAKAMKYHKSDRFLVAYFGDGTFAWNDSSVLKPFRAHFSEIQNHADLESFRNAVRCALGEVSRRVELGLACSCVPRDIYEKIKYQVVENGGVRRKSMKRHCRDVSAGVSSFEPDKLVDYVRQLARLHGEGDNMELAMAKAQLSSYGRYKGHRQLPEFQFYVWVEDDPILTIPHKELKQVNNGVKNASEEFGNDLIDITYSNKERSLSDLTDDAPHSGDGDGAEGGHITSKLISSYGSRKRKARGSISNSSVKRPNLRHDRVPAVSSVSAPKPSFKIGERIRKVASQLSGPTKAEHGQHADQLIGSVSMEIHKNSQTGMIADGKQESVAEMLSQLLVTAQDPMKGYSFLNAIIPFFYERRAAVFSKSLKPHSSINREVPVKKRKTSNDNGPEEFEFDEVDDSYWTDKVIQNHPEEQFLQDNQNGGVEYEVVVLEPDKPAKASRRSSKKQKSDKKQKMVSDNDESDEDEESELDELRRQNLATEVILKFTEGVYFPSELNLNKMFRRFGPLMESETEVDRQNCRARVIFKKCCDAEVAQSSAAQFKIFGAVNVNYELNYTPLVSYKPLPLPASQDPMDGS